MMKMFCLLSLLLSCSTFADPLFPPPGTLIFYAHLNRQSETPLTVVAYKVIESNPKEEFVRADVWEWTIQKNFETDKNLTSGGKPVPEILEALQSPPNFADVKVHVHPNELSDKIKNHCQKTIPFTFIDRDHESTVSACPANGDENNLVTMDVPFGNALSSTMNQERQEVLCLIKVY